MNEPATGGPEPKIHAVRADERQLLLRHREGDPEAFGALVKEYRGPVYAYLTRCGIETDLRDDLFQDIFIKIHRAAASYQAHRPPRTRSGARLRVASAQSPQAGR